MTASKKHLKNLLVAAAIAFSFFSCSLEYEKEEAPESSYPEFTFTNAEFTKIEKYKADSFSFAKNVEFKTFDDEGKDETSGSCDMISADTVKERYILLGDVKMDMISEDMKIEADSLNFDKKNEQITSGIDQKVTIKRNDIDMEGIGFSASGVSKTFAFDRDVAGEIETENEDEKKRTEPDGDKKQ